MTAKISWGEWHRRQWEVLPTTEARLDPAVGDILPRPTAVATCSTSQEKALAIGLVAEAWPVMTTEYREGERVGEGCTHADTRNVRVGWIFCLTRKSRWQGEGTTKDYYFHPGEDAPDLARMVKDRFGDPTEDNNYGGAAVEWWQVKGFVLPE